jgi:hypothetical protein
LTDDARQLIERFNTYCEISPSLTGVKLFVRGKPPGLKGRRRDGIEIYSTGRYFTVTGLCLPGMPLTIENRQEELAWLYERLAPARTQPSRALVTLNGVPGAPPSTDISPVRCPLSDSQILQMARKAKNGTKFEHLWSGDTTGYESPSNADDALCAMLAFYTGPDPERIERLFRQSELGKRDKWLKRKDYPDRTIQSALRKVQVFYTPDYMSTRGIMTNKSNQEQSGAIKRSMSNQEDTGAIKNNKSNQDESGIINTDGGGRACESMISPDLVERSVQMAKELALRNGKQPTWRLAFQLARRLQSLPGELRPEHFEQAVRALCEETNRDCEEFWYAFDNCWHQVRLPEGQDPIAVAARQAEAAPVRLKKHNKPRYMFVASLAWHLSRMTGESPFYLPLLRIAPLLGTNATDVSRILGLLKRNGVIRPATKDEDYSIKGRKAKEYFFIESSLEDDSLPPAAA